MHWLSSALMAVQVISSLSIIVLVLLQQGKGADMGASFGGGSAGSVFGASGAANFLSRVTKWAAIIFFVSTGGLAWYAHHPAAQPAVEGGIMQGFETPQVPSTGADVPVVPSQGQGASVPAAPAAGTTPQPAQPDASAVPSGSGASAPPAGASSPSDDKQSAGATASPPSGAAGQQGSDAATGQASQGVDRPANSSASPASASGEADSSTPAEKN